MKTKQTILKHYIRGNDRTPKGVAVAVLEDNHVTYGFSLLNDYRDKFNKKIGTAIAVNRATSKEYELPKVPERLSIVVEAFQNLQIRSLKYFKDLPEENVKLKELIA